MALTDKSYMPWGKHQGVEMANVPAYYLLWLYNNNKCSGDVKLYIEDNLQIIEQEYLKKKNNGN